MVKTTEDVMDINPLERMDKLEEISSEKRDTIASKKKEFEELERSKKREMTELDEKKKREMDDLDKKKKKDLEELDKKRKELQDLESKKLKEIEETQDLIERSFQDLMRHKRIILHEEEEEKNKKSSAKEVNLEEVASAASSLVPENSGMNYSKFFEKLQEPQRLYDVTNSSFYNGLTELRNRAASGEITPEEELFVQKLKNQFENFNSNQTYVEKDQNQYMRRSINVIEQIGKYTRMKE